MPYFSRPFALADRLDKGVSKGHIPCEASGSAEPRPVCKYDVHTSSGRPVLGTCLPTSFPPDPLAVFFSHQVMQNNHIASVTLYGPPRPGAHLRTAELP